MFRSRRALWGNPCKGKPLELTMAAGGMIVTVLACEEGGEGGKGEGGEGGGKGCASVCVECLLQLKSVLVQQGSSNSSPAAPRTPPGVAKEPTSSCRVVVAAIKCTFPVKSNILRNLSNILGKPYVLTFT